MACTGGGAISVVADEATGETFTGRSLSPRPWLTLGFDDMDRSFALDAYNHPPSYYGGSKYGHLIHFGAITRQLSDRFSSYKMADCTIEVDNSSRLLDTLETAAASQYWANREGRIYLASDTTIAAGGTPHTLFRGIWRGHKSQGLTRTITLTDILGSEFSDFNIEDTIPRRRIVDDHPDAPAAVLDRVVPIAYGRWSDTSVETTAIGTTLPYDATIPAVSSVIAHDIQSSGMSGGVTVIVTAVISGNEGPMSNPAGTYDFNRQEWVGWNNVTGADSYRIYVFDGSWGDWTPHGGLRPGATVTFVRMLTHDNSTLDGDWNGVPSRQYSVTFASAASGTDALSGVTTSSIDQGKGMVAPIYVGIVAVGGVDYHKFVLCGHAVQDIHELYIDGLAQNILTDATQADSGGIWLVPGFAGWTAAFGAGQYETVNGRRYASIYGKVGYLGPDRGAGLIQAGASIGEDVSEKVPLAVNFCAIEDVGDGTGSTITRAPRVAYHLLEQWVIQNYTTGAWAAPSASDDGIPWLNTASFQAMEAIEVLRVGGEGYEATIYLDEPISVRELLSRLLVNFDMRFGPNEHGQVIATHLDDFFDLSTAVVITDVQEIVDETNIDRRLEELENRVVYDYGWRPGSQTFDTEGASVEDAIAIANNRDKAVVGDRRAFTYVANQATADDVAGRALTIGKYPPRYVDIVCTLHAIRVRLGDIISVTDVEGIGATGWAGRALWVLGIQTMLNDLTEPVAIKLQCLDVHTFFSEAGVMGDATTLLNWSAESTANKTTYYFLADSTTGLFADGAPAKGMR